MIISNQELITIEGGAIKINGSLLEGARAIANEIFNIGVSLGKSLRKLACKSKLFSWAC